MAEGGSPLLQSQPACKAVEAPLLLLPSGRSQACTGGATDCPDRAFSDGTQQGEGASSPAPLSTGRPSQKGQAHRGPQEDALPQTTRPSAPHRPQGRHTPGLGLDCERVAPVLLLQADEHVIEVLVELQETEQAGCVGPPTSPSSQGHACFSPTLALPCASAWARNELCSRHQWELGAGSPTPGRKQKRRRKWAALPSSHGFWAPSLSSFYFLKCHIKLVLFCFELGFFFFNFSN